MDQDLSAQLAELDVTLESLRQESGKEGAAEPLRKAVQLAERLRSLCDKQHDLDSQVRQELHAHQEELRAQDEALEDSMHQRQELREYFDAVFMQAPMGYLVLGQSGVIRDFNRLAEEVLGAEGCALQGSTLRQWLAASHRQAFDRLCSQALRLGERQELVLQPGADKDGEKEESWLHAVVCPLQVPSEESPLLLCSLLDVTQQRRTHESLEQTAKQLAQQIREREMAQQDLQRQESRFRRIIAENADALLVVGLDGFVRLANPAADMLLGHEHGELEGALLGFTIVPSEMVLEQPGDEPPRVAELRYSEIDWEGEPARLVTLRDITDRKRSEEELRKAHDILEQRVKERTRELEDSYLRLHAEMQQRLQASARLQRIQKAVDSTGDAIVIAESMKRVEYCNPAVESIFGHDLQSLNVAGGLPELYKDEDVAERLAETFASGNSLDAEVTCRTVDGEEVPVLLRADAVRDDSGDCVALVVIHKDITELKQATEAMEASREEFRNLADNLPDMVARVDKDLCYTFANRALASAWGLSPEEVYGSCLRDLELPEDLYNLWISSLEEVLQQGVVRDMDFQYTREGKTSYYHTRIAPEFDTRGRVISCVSLSSNVTSRVEMERELRQSQKMEALGAMAAKIAHDFNNMLGVIMASAEMLQNWNRELPQEGMRRVQRISEAANTAAGIIERMLGFARSDKPAMKSIDLEAEVRKSLAMLHDGLPPTIALNYQCEGSGLIAQADNTLLQQILLNVGFNAKDAIGGAVGRIDVALDSLLLSASEISQQFPDLKPGWYARLSISDNGPGIKTDDQMRIFEPFYTTKGKGKGSGLGLSMVHRIMRQHEGAVRVESELGKGARFTFYLPLSGCSVLPIAQEEMQLGEVNAVVLLVDDEPVLLECLKEVLESIDCQVFAASNGILALQMLDELLDEGQKIDMLFTDQTMPGMSGVELIAKVREILPKLPVVLCSGYSDTLPKEHEKDKHMEILHKPFSSKELLQTVAGVLNVLR